MFWLRFGFLGLIGTWRLIVTGIVIAVLIRDRRRVGHWNRRDLVVVALIQGPLIVFAGWCFVAIVTPTSDAMVAAVVALLGISLLTQLWVRRRYPRDAISDAS